MIFRWRPGRIALIIGAFLLFLVIANQTSLLIAPCYNFSNTESKQNKENNPADYKCSSKEGIIVQGIFLLPEIHPEWWIALFTLTLWIATNLLWRTSIRHANHMERSVKIAEKAAAAARDSADALPILERAFVFIYTEFQQSYLDSTKTIADAVESHRTIFDITTAFGFVNHGKTPAIIKEISFGSFVVEGKTEFPQYPASILDSVVVVPSGGLWPERMAKRSIIPLPDEYKNVHEFRPNIVINNVTEAEGEAILNGKAFVVALAKVSYLDIFDRQHETAICRIYDGHTFAEHGGDKYNYRT